MLLGAQCLMADTYTVYYVNSDNHGGKLYCYGWTGGSNNKWAGALMTKESYTFGGFDVWKAELDAQYDNCIFNNKGEGGSNDWESGTITLGSSNIGKIYYSGKWNTYSATESGWWLNIQNDARDDYREGVQFVKASAEATIATASVTLGTGNVDYEFYIGNGAGGSARHTNTAEAMSSLACIDWVTYEGYGSGKLHTTTTGTYTFSIDLITHKVSIVYPSYSVAISSLNYATLCLPVEVSIPSGVEAYYESAYSFNSTTNVVDVTFSALTGYIPAGVPVILHSSSADTYTFSHTSTSAANPLDLQSEFKGVYNYKSYAELGLSGETAYVLQDYEDGGDHFFGFHKLNTSGHINASRCYLVVGTTGELHAPSVRMYLPGEVTYIENIEANEDAVKFIQDGKLFIKKNGIVYDMMGTIVK